MDVAWLLRQRFDSRKSSAGALGPFPGRPWMRDSGAAAAPAGNVGLKGIIAGESSLLDPTLSIYANLRCSIYSRIRTGSSAHRFSLF